MEPAIKTNDNYYNTLMRRMVLTIFFVSLTPLFLVSGIILYQFHISYQEKVYDHLKELVQKHKQNIDNFLKERLADICFMVDTVEFESLSDESFLKNRLELLQKSYGPIFVDLGLVNSQGVQVAYAGPFRLEKANYCDADWFKQAIKTRFFISDVFLGLRGLPHFIVAVRKNWKGKDWILRATIDFKAFNNLVENIHIGKTGFAFIFNTKGELQTKPFLDIMPDRNIYMRFVKQTDFKKNHHINVVSAIDHLGKKKIYVSAFLKNGNWIMVFQQDFSDAFSDLRKTMVVTAFILLMGTLGIVTMALILSEKIIKRIAKVDQEKERMNEQVVQAGKLAAIGELAAGIAHEINNPVAIMVEEAGWIGDLLEEEEFQNSDNLKELRRAVNQVKTQGRRCKEITHKLLSFARKTDPMVQDVDIGDLISELVGLSEQRAKYAKVTINTKIEKGLLNVSASQSELQQVFLNLINNSLDAMEKDGGVLDIAAYQKGGHLVVTVSDTGPGIPEANLQRIFDPFFTTKPVGKGTGLGLSICYGIIKKMGGEITVKSTVGKGTTFIIKLPVNNQTVTGQSGDIHNTSRKGPYHE